MITIDWVEIPEGECSIGLSDAQRADIRTRLNAEYGLDQLDVATRRIVHGMVEKYWRTAREATYFASDHLTSAERRVEARFPHLRDEYFAIEANLERIPPQRQVWVPTFYIARFPITHAQADSFFASDHVRWRELNRARIQPQADALPDMPEQIYWPMADAMAHWLGGRLPTVIEWEKAARGIDGRLYPWGNIWDAARGNFGPEYRPAYSRQHGIGRTVVDAYPGGVSPYGVWDMNGNLSEWTMTRTIPDVKSTREAPLVKGTEAKNVQQPEWFWSIIAHQHPGSRYSGFRPVLTRWQHQIWRGGDIPSLESEQ
jgi:formylglycine-generating enzyme required for sulfatase activity